MLRFLVSLLVSCFIATAAGAQVKMEWDFQKNKKFLVAARTINEQHVWFVQPILARDAAERRDQAATQLGTLMACSTQSPAHCLPLAWLGNRLVESKQTMEQVTRYQFEVKDKSDKGLVIEEQILDIRMFVSGVQSNLPLAKKLEGHACKVTLGPTFEIVSFDGYDEMIKSATQELPEKDRDKEATRLRLLLSEATMRGTIREMFAILPTEPVEVGKTWSAPESIEQIAGIGEARRTTTYSYEGKGTFKSDGKERQGYRIASKSSMKLSALPASAGSGSSGAPALPFQVTRADISAEKALGEVYFDPEKNRPVSIEARTYLKGVLSIRFQESADQTELFSFIEQEVSRDLRIMDMPEKKPPPAP